MLNQIDAGRLRIKMANVGNFDTQRMHTQLTGKANFKELTRREDTLQYRRLNYILIALVISLLGYTILHIRFGINELAIWTGVGGFIFLLILAYRLRLTKKKRKEDAKKHNKKRKKYYKKNRRYRHRK